MIQTDNLSMIETFWCSFSSWAKYLIRWLKFKYEWHLQKFFKDENTSNSAVEWDKFNLQTYTLDYFARLQLIWNEAGFKNSFIASCIQKPF